MLAYRRNPAPTGGEYDKLEPGTCSWTPYADAGIPPEPGVVHFDIDPVGSEFVASPESMAAWMADPAHYWSFFVDDKSNVSISHGPYGAQFRSAPTTRDKPENSTAASLRREQLRCRGGGGYDFAQPRRLGPNLVAVQLSYRVAKSQAGRLGRGLEPGTCAWDDRTNARAEPGQIVFTAPGNAQLKQQQSGSEVDRSPTAAERWPDVHTIPPYLNDPAHYWTFTVSLANPDLGAAPQGVEAGGGGGADPSAGDGRPAERRGHGSRRRHHARGRCEATCGDRHRGEPARRLDRRRALRPRRQHDVRPEPSVRHSQRAGEDGLRGYRSCSMRGPTWHPLCLYRRRRRPARPAATASGGSRSGSPCRGRRSTAGTGTTPRRAPHRSRGGRSTGSSPTRRRAPTPGTIRPPASSGRCGSGSGWASPTSTL